MARSCGTCLRIIPKKKKGRRTSESKALELPFQIVKIYKRPNTRVRAPMKVSQPKCNYNMNKVAVENKLRPVLQQRKKDTEYTPQELQRENDWFPKENNYTYYLKTMKRGMKRM
jgi:hypothetical protein